VSEDALAQLDDMAFEWTATGEGVWRNSCVKSDCPDEELHSKYALFSPTRVGNFKAGCFFAMTACRT